MKTSIGRLLAMPLLLVLSAGLSAQNIDWGDAPDPAFPTLAKNNGAHHLIVPGIFLGAGIDAEIDGQVATGMSRGDDYNGLDDADGVIFNSWLIAGQQASVIVIASAPGFLNAWMDLNVDGDWLDAGEQVFLDVQLVAGHNNLTINVPATIPPGLPATSRFRFSTQGGLTYTGMAIDGEVEDYDVILGMISSTEIVIDPDPTGLFTQNEISVAIIPGQLFGPPDLIVAAYNDEPFPGGPGIGISYSTDVGATWANTHLPYPVSGVTGVVLVDAFDPSITMDDQGNIYAAHISSDANWWNGPVTGLYVHKSTDGGQTWPSYVPVDEKGAPVAGTDTAYRLNDRDQIICDRYPMSPYHNNLYIAWIQDRGWNMPSPWGDIYFSYSNDAGVSFSPAHRINSWINDMGNMPTLDVGKDGTIYVTWMNYNVQSGGQGIIFLDKSSDGGITWGPDIPVDTINLPPLHLNGNTDARAKGAPVIRVLPSDPNHLCIVFAEDPDGTGPDEADIFMRTSTDGGNTWPMSAKIRVNDDNTPNGQILPWMSIKQNDIIDIAWYDRRYDVTNKIFDVFFTYSTDGGLSFAPNTRVNQFPFYAAFVMKTGDQWFGEYLGLATDYNDAFIVHTSNNYDQLGDVIFLPWPNPEPYKDWGDAPDPLYPTLSVNQGASHIYDPTIFLGSQIDAEHDGIPDANASGDDNYNINDEDGVSIPSPLLIGQLDTISIVASASGYLNAWIDYDGNGTWADQGEQVYSDQMLVAGINLLAITVPGNAAEITTFARFRFSSLAGLGYTGQAPDGEVEDFMVVLDDQTGVDAPEDSGINLQISPNPVSREVMIRYQISDIRYLISDLYDISGIKIHELVHEVKLPGEHEIKIDVSDLAPGVYFIRIQAGSEVNVRKLVIVH
ncbi:MAG: GEVED domain-containing protein [Bacteroidota bacterium]|nr:GEVED domain-containing protein [Bacteroidota bacterium]